MQVDITHEKHIIITDKSKNKVIIELDKKIYASIINQRHVTIIKIDSEIISKRSSKVKMINNY